MLPGLYVTPGSVWPIDYPIRIPPIPVTVSFLILLCAADLLQELVHPRSMAKEGAQRLMPY